jgi:hypothetical protein
MFFRLEIHNFMRSAEPLPIERIRRFRYTFLYAVYPFSMKCILDQIGWDVGGRCFRGSIEPVIRVTVWWRHEEGILEDFGSLRWREIEESERQKKGTT